MRIDHAALLRALDQFLKLLLALPLVRLDLGDCENPLI